MGTPVPGSYFKYNNLDFYVKSIESRSDGSVFAYMYNPMLNLDTVVNIKGG